MDRGEAISWAISRKSSHLILGTGNSQNASEHLTSGYCRYRPLLFLATVIHVVDLVSRGAYVSYVLALPAMDLIPLPIFFRRECIVAIPAVEESLPELPRKSSLPGPP